MVRENFAGNNSKTICIRLNKLLNFISEFWKVKKLDIKEKAVNFSKSTPRIIIFFHFQFIERKKYLAYFQIPL